MRKTRLLTLLLLLMTAVTGAWANDYLYLEVSGESATMKYGSDYYGKPYYDERADWWYDGYEWNGKGTIKTITVDVSCQNVDYSNLSSLFYDFTALQTINNTANLNTSQVEDMSRMFVNCSSFTKLDLSAWDTGEVTDMLSMFDGCLALTALNISGWNTGELTNTQGMFENCVNLKFIYVGADWSTTKVTNGVGMFYGCENLPNWDNTTDVSKAYVGDGGYLTSNMKTIYCKMEYGWWTQDGAAIGIYAWGDNNQKNADYPGKRMTLADGETNIWKFDLDIAKYENCIFTRVNGSGDIADWGAKTQDLTIPTNDDNMFTITSSTAVWGGSGCEGEWSKYVAPKFLISGSMTNWDENMIKVYADSYTFGSLYPGKYQFKVIDNGSRKGIDDMTEVAGGLYKDQDGNVCFILNDVSDVTINYKSGELFTVDVEVEDRLVAPEMKLIGNFVGDWTEYTEPIAMTTAADKKSASLTMTLNKGWYDFKVIRGEEWLGKENAGDDNYRIYNDWNWVDGLVRDYSGLKAISLELAADDVNKEFTFTYDYAAGKLTVIYPGLNTITIDDGNIDAANWSAEPTEQYDGQNVTLKYKGKKKIKRITIVAAPTGPTAYTLAESTVGMIVGTDGKAYAAADKDNLPSGVTAVAMVAYKSGSNGLAIQLNGSPVSKNWADAKTYAEGLDEVSGGTWRLPSKADWQNILVGCAVPGDASSPDANGKMEPIAGFKAKIAATGITWQSGYYWSSTESGSNAWGVNVDPRDGFVYAQFREFGTSMPPYVLGCLAF